MWWNLSGGHWTHLDPTSTSGCVLRRSRFVVRSTISVLVVSRVPEDLRHAPVEGAVRERVRVRVTANVRVRRATLATRVARATRVRTSPQARRWSPTKWPSPVRSVMNLVAVHVPGPAPNCVSAVHRAISDTRKRAVSMRTSADKAPAPRGRATPTSSASTTWAPSLVLTVTNRARVAMVTDRICVSPVPKIT